MLIIKDGNLFDGTGSDIQERVSIVIENHKIERIGSFETIEVETDAEIIDATGCYVTPGLIDSHVHIMFEDFNQHRRLETPFSMMFYEALANMRATLESGVTTVRDCGGADSGVKTAVEKGLISGPRLLISIDIISQTGGHGETYFPMGVTVPVTYPGKPPMICDGVGEALKTTRLAVRSGADFIKIATSGGILSANSSPDVGQFSMEEIEAIVGEADRTGRKVASHAQSKQGIINALKAGVNSIEHGIYIDNEAIDLMLEKNAFLVPTLVAPISIVEKGEKCGTIPEYSLNKAKKIVDIHFENVAKAIDAGVRVALGTDASVGPHGDVARELELMKKAGLSDRGVLMAATRTAAECLDRIAELGTVETGKLADLLVLNRNPLEDIKIFKEASNILHIIKDGTVLK